MRTLVMKFGGASVSSTVQFIRIAQIIGERAKDFERLVVVVSAMGNTTDNLLKMAHEVNDSPPKRELDMLITVGERISCSLLAMALEKTGLAAISFTGSQSGVITSDKHNEARVIEVRPHRILAQLDKGRVVVVAGFQGVSRQGEITTLGRGGSDTTAVALAVALGAERVEFFKDVPGIYAEDPKINPFAHLYKELTHQEALSIIKGSQHQVLHERSIIMAQKNGLSLHILCFKKGLEKEKSPGTFISGSLKRDRAPIYEEAQ